MKVETAVYKRSRPSAAAARSRGVGQNVGPPVHPGGVIIGSAPPPELATLTPQPPQHPHIALPTQPYQMHHHSQQQQQQQQQQQHHHQQQQHMILAGTQQQKLIRRGHQMEMLEQAKHLCDRQDFVDVTIYCEDGVVRAHQMLLAVASPFLKLLFQTSPLYGIEDICIILPETKACLVQALIHFVYTGTVVSKEDHFYSLMKLVYALSINASIEAESTNARPTAFSAPLVPLHTVERVRRLPHQLVQPNLPTVPNHQHMTHMTMQQHQQQQSVNAAAAAAVAAITTPALAPPCVIPQAKMGRYTSGPPANSLPVPQHSLTNSHQTNKMPIQLPTQPVPLVNGVTIKNEPQQQQHHVTSGSYIAIDPNTGLHYKVEVPNGQLTGDLGSDPLAAIMHETIFTETSAGGQTTMYTTENGHVIYTTQPATTVSVPTLMGTTTVTQQQHQMDPNDMSVGNMGTATSAPTTPAKRGKKRKQNNKENAIMAESVDDLPCAPDDEDLNTPYACAHCNKTIKGRVMLQAHQYQEHYDNPELSRIDIGDKHACRVCLKLFTRNSDVKAHILRVHCGDRRYPCTMCGKRFKESTHLRKHLYTHTGERPHYCTLCDKGFQTSSDLKRHKRTRVHQERVEQLKSCGEGSPPGGSASDPNANPDFNRWVDDDDDEDDQDGSRDHNKVHLKGGVNSTAQQLLTSITQPVSMVSANGQQMESTIDMKALGGGVQTGGSNSNSSSAPLTVPVSSSWNTDSAASTTHYDLKDLTSNSGSNDVDMNALMQQHNDHAPVTTTSSASMPSIVDLHQHHHDVHQRQQQQLLQQQLDHHSGGQMFLQEQQYQEIATTSQDLSVHKKDMKGSMDSPPGGHDEEERLTVVEDEESSSNPVV